MHLLLITQAATYIGRHPDTLRRWDNAGLLPRTIRTDDGRRLFVREDLDAIMAWRAAFRPHGQVLTPMEHIGASVALIVGGVPA